MVQAEENVSLMEAAGTIVWLDPSIETILVRLKRSPTKRPLFESDLQVRALYESRFEAYSNCDFRIRVEEGDEARGVAHRIGRLLRSHQ